MLSKYDLFCSVDLKHDYFAKSEGIKLHFKPDPVTQKACQQYGIRCQLEKSPLGLFYQNPGNSESPLLVRLRQDEPLCLRFLLQTSDPLFFMYTDLDAVKLPDQIIVSSTRGKEGGELSKELYPVGPVNPIFREDELTGFDKDGVFPLELLDANGNRDKLQQHQLNYDTNSSGWYISPNSIPLGVYCFQTGDIRSSPFVSLANEPRQTTVGVLEIWLKEKPESLSPFLSSDSLVNRSYSIHFKARPTIWRYHFFTSTNLGHPLKPDMLQLSFPEGIPDFELSPVDPNIPGDGLVASFQSVKPILLRDMYALDTNISGYLTISGFDPKIQLPIPAASFTNYKDGQWYSEVFVHI